MTIDWQFDGNNRQYVVKKAIIEDGVTSIGYRAFYDCGSPTSVTIKAINPPTGGYIFDSIEKIYVSAESVDAYKAADGWSNYADKIQAITE